MSATLRLPKFLHEIGKVCPASHGRYALAGIHFKVSDTGKAVACATDGKILVEVTLDNATDVDGAIAITLDPKSLKTALVACHMASRDPVIILNEEACTVEGNGTTFVVEIIRGTFPRYEDVIPSDVSTVGMTSLSVDLNPEFLSKLSLSLFRACGKSADYPSFTFAFHGPKNPVRVDFQGDTFKGRGVIMPSVR